MPPTDTAHRFDVGAFRPHPLFRGGHAQTLAGAYLPARLHLSPARQYRVTLADGDQIVLHDSLPAGWSAPHGVALLVHGLGGSYQSGYMCRVAAKLLARGVRVFRMDLRGAGAGIWLARVPYHSGRSDDVRAVLDWIAGESPQAPVVTVGFSLGGNIVLKLLGEVGTHGCSNLVGGAAVSPPVELATCCQRIGQRGNRLYDRRFVVTLLEQHRERLKRVPETPVMQSPRPPRTLLEVDDWYTGPVNGFGNAENYYRTCSSAAFVPEIALPTLILSAADDPLIPVEIFHRLQLPAPVRLHLAEGGGHLGFIARRGQDADRRWMDWRVVEWVEYVIKVSGG